MRLAKLLAMIGLAVVIHIPGTSAAADSCSDVLQKNDLLSKTKITDRSYLSQYMYRKFVSSSTEDIKKTIDTGANYYGITGYGNADDIEKRKQQIARTDVGKLRAQTDVDLLLTSGDPVIIGAWRECMTQRGGLSLTFQILESARDATLLVEWFPLPGIATQTLKADVLPQGAMKYVTGGAECVTKGSPLTNGVPCPATLRLPNARTTLNVRGLTENGSATAFLAPRRILVSKTRAHKFSQGSDLRTGLGWGHHSRRSPQADPWKEVPGYQAGWRFIPSSFNLTLVGNPNNQQRCGAAEQKASFYLLSYCLVVKNDDTAAGLVCSLKPSVMEEREVWEDMP